MVAKSFQALEMVTEPYQVGDKMYIKVRNQKTGTTRQVRWYTESEYKKMYPEVVVNTVFKNHKEVLGFEKGYITIFKGNIEANEDWFRASNARYARWWGWYIISTEDIPVDLPVGITPIQLNWNDISTDGISLKNENEIKKHVSTLLYDPDPSEFKGKIGERIDVEVVISKAIPIDGQYGHSIMHIMRDNENNVYVWSTAARTLNVGETYKLKGTIKDHRLYCNTKQTILTRCMEVK